MNYLVTFSDESMSRSRRLCAESAKAHGVDKAVECVPQEPSVERGYGFWKWKPQIISHLMNGLDGFVSPKDGDVVVYADAGVEFINSVRYIIDRMDQDIFLFGNQWEHAHWCKRDIIEEVSEPWHKEWSQFGKQVQASVIFFRVSDYTRRFVKEWLDWCLFEGGRLIDDSPSRASNHPEFRENRHDQAILTTLAYREGIKLHWWPASYNDGAFSYPKDGYELDSYPVLFNHHRRRNVDWGKALCA